MMFVAINEDALRKLARLFNKIDGPVVLRDSEEVEASREALNERLTGSGTVQLAFAKRVLTTYDWCLNRYHYKDKKTALEHILMGKRIHPSSFKSKEEIEGNEEND